MPICTTINGWIHDGAHGHCQLHCGISNHGLGSSRFTSSQSRGAKASPSPMAQSLACIHAHLSERGRDITHLPFRHATAATASKGVFSPVTSSQCSSPTSVPRPQNRAYQTLPRAVRHSGNSQRSNSPPRTARPASAPPVHPRQLTALVSSCSDCTSLLDLALGHSDRLNEIHVAGEEDGCRIDAGGYRQPTLFLLNMIGRPSFNRCRGSYSLI